MYERDIELLMNEIPAMLDRAWITRDAQSSWFATRSETDAASVAAQIRPQIAGIVRKDRRAFLASVGPAAGKAPSPKESSAETWGVLLNIRRWDDFPRVADL
jgi:hypothetical protein